MPLLPVSLSELGKLSVVNSETVGLISQLEVDLKSTQEDSVELQLSTSVSLATFSIHSIS